MTHVHLRDVLDTYIRIQGTRNDKAIKPYFS